LLHQDFGTFLRKKSLNLGIKAMEDEMNQAARELAFEKAAELRDQIKALKKIMLY